MPIYALENVKPSIAEDAFVAPSADIIGDVHIKSRASIWFNCVLRGDGHKITIGTGSNLQDGTVVHITTGQHETYVGDNVLVGHSALLHGCHLEDNSFVGFAAQVMDGCVIEKGAMLAAGSLLTPGKRIPEYQLWAGRPARFVRVLSAEEQAYNHAGVMNYQNLASYYLHHLRRIDNL